MSEPYDMAAAVTDRLARYKAQDAEAGEEHFRAVVARARMLAVEMPDVGLHTIVLGLAISEQTSLLRRNGHIG